jgi:hypothetical protein
MLTYALPSFYIQFYQLLPLMTVSWVQPQQKQVNIIFNISSVVRKWCSILKLSFLKGHKNYFMKYPQVLVVLRKTDFIKVSSITCYSEHITSFQSIHKDMILVRCCDWSKQFQQACLVSSTTVPTILHSLYRKGQNINVCTVAMLTTTPNF